jgi:Na+/H+-dicarboxylate symporter
MRKHFTLQILASAALGVLVGWALNASTSDQAQLKAIAGYFSIVTTIFLRLIKMIIAPLVFGTLVSGIAGMGEIAGLGRVAAKTLGWFVLAGLTSLILGLLLSNWLAPGAALHLPLPVGSQSGAVDHGALSITNFVTHIVPDSIADAMAGNQILQIIVFSTFFGVASSVVGEKAAPLIRATEALVAIMLQVTDFVMRFAPLAVFAALAAALTEQGPGMIGKLAYFIGGVYLGLALLWSLLGLVAFLVVGRRAKHLARSIRVPVLLAFSAASSEAAFPRTLEALEKFGVPNRIASFVLPLGYSFNLDGSMMYMTFASLFVAQAYGIVLPLGAQIAMLLTLMVTSKGVAGVPRAALVVVAATLSQFNLPQEGLLLILAVDHFLDMGRSATNVVGNAVASVVIARWEGHSAKPARPNASRSGVEALGALPELRAAPRVN